MVLLAMSRSIVALGGNNFPTAVPLLAAPLLLPFLMAGCGREWHQRWRESVVGAVRLYLVVLAGWMAAKKSAVGAQEHGNAELLLPGSALACWAAAGGETLLTPAFGLQLRTVRHAPLQLVALVLLMFNISSLCGEFSSAGACIRAFGTAGVFGFVVPTLLLRKAEMSTRRTFEGQISAAAGLAC